MSRETPPVGATAAFAAFLAGVSMDDVPDAVAQRVRHLILDGLGCGLVGAQLPWSRQAMGVLKHLGPGSSAGVWGWDTRATPATAALLNGTFVQGFELDDFNARSPLHTSAVVLPAALAAAEHLGITSARVFFDAALAGYEAGGRVGQALGASELVLRGWHSGSVLGPVPAAVSAGRVWGLAPAVLDEAIGTAATQAGGLMAAQYGGMVKRMHHGFAARNGVTAAALSAEGFVGIPAIFEHDFGGFVTTFVGDQANGDPDALTSGLGERWELMGIGVKHYACMIGLHAAIDAALSIRADDRFSVEKTRRVEVRVGRSVFKKAAFPIAPPVDTIAAQMSLRYVVAVALLDGAIGTVQFTDERLQRPEVWELIDRVEVLHDPAIDDRGRDWRFAASIAAAVENGGVVESDAPPPSHQARSFDDAATRDKFLRLVPSVLGRARTDAIIEWVLGCDLDDELHQLHELLAPAAAPAL